MKTPEVNMAQTGGSHNKIHVEVNIQASAPNRQLILAYKREAQLLKKIVALTEEISRLKRQPVPSYN